MAGLDPERYERAARRWLQRFIDERLPPLTEVALAAAAWPTFDTVAEMPGAKRSSACSAVDSPIRFCKMRLYAL